jgi:hypothetical protein
MGLGFPIMGNIGAGLIQSRPNPEAAAPERSSPAGDDEEVRDSKDTVPHVREHPGSSLPGASKAVTAAPIVPVATNRFYSPLPNPE